MNYLLDKIVQRLEKENKEFKWQYEKKFAATYN